MMPDLARFRVMKTLMWVDAGKERSWWTQGIELELAEMDLGAWKA